MQRVLGRLPDKHGAPLDFVEAATASVVLREVASGAIDLVVLDGEARPAGGMGLAKQLKDELLQPPPIVVLTARADDTWLAGWSGADAIVPRTLDPIVTIDAVTPLLRSRLIL